MTSVPDVSAISTAFAKSAPQTYVNTLNGISTHDISNPESPALLGLSADAALRERTDDARGAGRPTRALRPRRPRPVRPGWRPPPACTPCLGGDCTYACSASASDDGAFSVFDLSDLDDPVELETMSSAAGSGHQWDDDAWGLVWHSGFGGIAAYDVTDPLNPVPVGSTNNDGVSGLPLPAGPRSIGGFGHVPAALRRGRTTRPRTPCR